MRFSQRIGKRLQVPSIQLEGMDSDLKNRLWNLVKLLILDKISRRSSYGDTEFDVLGKSIWHRFYKLPIDTIPEYDFQIEAEIRKKFFEAQWYDVYDFIEFLSTLEYENVDVDGFIEAANDLLEQEFSGYRFIDGLIAPISNEIEVKEIEEALQQNNYYTSLEGANIHLSKALDKLSEKKNPDYRNSIKESISAVETTCRVLTGEATLGKALKSLEKNGLKVDEQLKNGFEKIYAYTNSQEGIRHAIVDNSSNPDFDDAKYMLVTCSAFINYLVGKCKTLNLPIQ